MVQKINFVIFFIAVNARDIVQKLFKQQKNKYERNSDKIYKNIWEKWVSKDFKSRLTLYWENVIIILKIFTRLRLKSLKIYNWKIKVKNYLHSNLKH